MGLCCEECGTLCLRRHPAASPMIQWKELCNCHLVFLHCVSHMSSKRLEGCAPLSPISDLPMQAHHSFARCLVTYRIMLVADARCRSLARWLPSCLRSRHMTRRARSAPSCPAHSQAAASACPGGRWYEPLQGVSEACKPPAGRVGVHNLADGKGQGNEDEL